MSNVTPINPSDNFNEDPLENLLDEESDEDFGYVVTRDRATGPDGHPVKLAEWSAQDFASIYTRFRPHLERHARRFLNNPSQIDEVVQDAFLYLMVSLPELDSEIGVLRFLKWKVRLLCIDVMRASGKAYIANIDDVPEQMSSDPEIGSSLEQQDDAAILRLALSKLNPRHREVLLASIYEEKSTLEIANQVGLSENATRQLIFRARAAFKKALLGEDVDTNGMSAAAILSVAARKAAMEAKKVGAQAMIFGLALLLGIGAFVNFANRGPQTQVAESQAPALPGSSASPTPTPTPTGTANGAKAPAKAPAPKPTTKPTTKPDRISFPASPETAVSSSLFSKADLSKVFDTSKNDAVFVRTSAATDAITAPTNYRVYASQGIFADFTFDYDSERVVYNSIITVMVGGKAYFASPLDTELVVFKDKQGLEHIVFFGNLTNLLDAKGKLLAQNELSRSTIRLELVLKQDKSGLENSSLFVLSDGQK